MIAKEILPTENSNEVIEVAKFPGDSHDFCYLVSPDISNIMEQNEEFCERLKAPSYTMTWRYNKVSGKRIEPVRGKDWINDLLQVCAWVRHVEGGQPPILICRGWSALIGAGMMRQYERFIRGIVFVDPKPSRNIQSQKWQKSRLLKHFHAAFLRKVSRRRKVSLKEIQDSLAMAKGKPFLKPVLVIDTPQQFTQRRNWLDTFLDTSVNLTHLTVAEPRSMEQLNGCPAGTIDMIRQWSQEHFGESRDGTIEFTDTLAKTSSRAEPQAPLS